MKEQDLRENVRQVFLPVTPEIAQLHLGDLIFYALVLHCTYSFVAGVTAAGWHFLGWALVLIASTGWTSARLPRGLCLLYLTAGIASLFIYVLPDLEGTAALLGVFWAIWQGVFLWKAEQ